MLGAGMSAAHEVRLNVSLEMGWRYMYLGALAAFGVTSIDVSVPMLLEQTRSDDECIHAIGVMRRAKSGDRVWPALEALKEMRKAENR